MGEVLGLQPLRLLKVHGVVDLLHVVQLLLLAQALRQTSGSNLILCQKIKERSKDVGVLQVETGLVDLDDGVRGLVLGKRYLVEHQGVREGFLLLRMFAHVCVSRFCTLATQRANASVIGAARARLHPVGQEGKESPRRRPVRNLRDSLDHHGWRLWLWLPVGLILHKGDACQLFLVDEMDRLAYRILVLVFFAGGHAGGRQKKLEWAWHNYKTERNRLTHT